MRTEYRYKATGSTDFPIDMLRYDKAIPLTEADSSLVWGSIANRGVAAQHKVPAVIELRSAQEPTGGRWLSFGWIVTDVQKVRVA